MDRVFASARCAVVPLVGSVGTASGAGAHAASKRDACASPGELSLEARVGSG